MDGLLFSILDGFFLLAWRNLETKTYKCISLTSDVLTSVMIVVNIIPHSFRVILMIQSTKELFLELYKIYSITSTIWMKIWSFTLR